MECEMGPTERYHKAINSVGRSGESDICMWRYSRKSCLWFGKSNGFKL